LPRSLLTTLLLVTSVAVPLLFLLLDQSLVFEVSEGREGVVVQEVIDSGNLILPLRNGHIVPSKPVLFHWVGAAVASVLDMNVDEFVLRFPSALGALGCVLVITWLLTVTTSPAHGLLAAAVLLSTNGFQKLAMNGRVDMLFCFFVTAATCCWLRAASESWEKTSSLSQIKSSTYLLTAVLAGLAVLTKGPLGIVLVGLVIGIVTMSFCGIKGCRHLIRWQWLVTLMIAVPWYFAAASLQGDSFIGRQLFFENLNRFSGGEGITPKPPWFYLEKFWLQTAPWSFLLLIIGVKFYLAWRRNNNWQELVQRKLFLPKKESFLLRSSFLWIVSTIVFYSLSTGKRSGYLLTLMPAIAIAVTLLLSGLFLASRKYSEGRKATPLIGRKIYVSGLISIVTIVAVPLAVYLIAKFTVWQSYVKPPKVKLIYDLFPFAVEYRVFVVVLLFSTLSILSVYFWRAAFYRNSIVAFAISVFCFLQLIQSVIVPTGLSVKGYTHSYRDFAGEVASLVPKNEKIKFIKTLKDESFDGFFFYFKRHVQYLPPRTKLKQVEARVETQLPGIYLARQRWVDKLSADEKARLNVITTGGRLTDEPGEKLVLFQFPAVADSAASDF